MNYDEHIQSLYETVPGFPAAVGVIERLGKREKPRILNFSHHDLDGVASAFILKRFLEKYLGASVVVKMPAHFKLWEEALIQTIEREGEFDLLLISDKGTFAYYDDFLKHVKEVLIIDHHQLNGRPLKCTVFNPTVETEGYAAATSLLSHMLVRKLGLGDAMDDFAALIGCRGDFAFDPVEKTASDFAEPFLGMMRRRFPALFEVKTGNPTMYDLVDRRRTAFVNQIGEVLQAGTLAHLYSENLGLGVKSGPRLVHDFLFELCEREENPAKFLSVGAFLGEGPKGKILSRVFDQFKNDWRLLEKRLENPVFLGEIRGVGVYMFFAREVNAMAAAPFPAILPFVASTKIEYLKRVGEHPHAAVIVFCPKEKGVHASMRGGGGIINLGKMCLELAGRIRKSCRQERGIGGGGHSKAAELLADKPAPMYTVMHELLLLVQEMVTLSKALDDETATPEQIEKSKKLGIID
jgi:hypothetical protein